MRSYARSYTYDKLGNVTQVKQTGSNGFTRNFKYTTGQNTLQLIEDGSSVLIEAFTYDANGNQVTAGTTRNYVWNHADQLLCYFNKAGSANPTVFTQYDYGGQARVSKLVRTGTSGTPIYERTIYIDGVFEYVILENGTTYEKNYIHLMDDQSRIAEVRVNIGPAFPGDISDAVTYTLGDQIGSAVVRLNNSGGVIDREEYYPFGDSSLRTFTYKRYRYVGKERDSESGLYYYGARYYAAWTCRFISVDPLAGDYPHLTPYNYAGNKPINDYDIDGMQDGNTGGTPQGSDGGEGGIKSGDAKFDAKANAVLNEAKVNGVDVKIDYATTDGKFSGSISITQDGETNTANYTSEGGWTNKGSDNLNTTGAEINASKTVFDVGKDLELRKTTYVEPYKSDLANYKANPTQENKTTAAVNRQNNLAETREKLSPLSQSASNAKKTNEQSLTRTNEIISGKRELGGSTNKGFDRLIPYRNIFKAIGIAGIIYAANESLNRVIDSGGDPNVIMSELGGWAGALMVGAMAAAAVVVLGPVAVLAAGIIGGMAGFWLGSGQWQQSFKF